MTLKDEQLPAAPGFPVERVVGWPEPKRATLASMAAKLRAANPNNRPMFLRWMAAQWWPDADWLTSKMHNHNGGAKRGVRVAGAFAGRLERAGLLRMCGGDGPRCYVWREPPNVGIEPPRSGRLE